MRKPIIAANWKMNKLAADGARFVMALREEVPEASKVDSVVCAPYIHLPFLTEAARDTPIRIGAQNMHHEQSGAYTGEVSPEMLENILVDYVIIGHSERRQHFHEDDELINQKVKAAMKNDLLPIVCVGESLEQRENGETNQWVKKQVQAAFEGVREGDAKKAVIAYEPIWAIGTGKTASNEDANEVCKTIRETLQELYSESLADQVRIQYGGSVKPENIAELLSMSDIDGALVGGASLEKDAFVKLLEAGANAN